MKMKPTKQLKRPRKVTGSMNDMSQSFGLADIEPDLVRCSESKMITQLQGGSVFVIIDPAPNRKSREISFTKHKLDH